MLVRSEKASGPCLETHQYEEEEFSNFEGARERIRRRDI